MRFCLCLSSLILVLPLWSAEPVVSTDLMIVRENEPLEISIPVRNTNDRAIEITDIDATCTCNKLELADKFLLPFQTTTLELGLENDNQSGKREHKVWMFSSNPKFEPLIAKVRWEIIPNVAVDVLPNNDMSQRPADEGMRDVYGFTIWVKPDEIATRLSLRGPDIKKIRLWSPPETAPEGGLRIEGIDYEGSIWQFTTRQFDDAWLLVAHGKDGAAETAPGKYTEEVLVRTNHPDKPTIKLVFYTAIDPKAGTAEGIDPWGHMR